MCRKEVRVAVFFRELGRRLGSGCEECVLCVFGGEGFLGRYELGRGKGGGVMGSL